MVRPDIPIAKTIFLTAAGLLLLIVFMVVRLALLMGHAEELNEWKIEIFNGLDNDVYVESVPDRFRTRIGQLSIGQMANGTPCGGCFIPVDNSITHYAMDHEDIASVWIVAFDSSTRIVGYAENFTLDELKELDWYVELNDGSSAQD